MKHASLFSGIGGFDLAASWTGIKTVFQVENDKWCLRVLEKNFPNAKRFEDIRQFSGKPYRGKIDILTGGFPCQPFSVAGKRKGKKDLRFLWPEMLRVIKEIQPAVVVCENVTGIISMVFDQMLTDLESAGYKTETFVIPACAKNAPHRRNRLWVIAYTNCTGRKKQHITHFSKSARQHTRLSAPRRIDWRTKPRLDRVGYGIPKRVDRIKGLGNAIVPQIAVEIFKSIKSVRQQKQTDGLGQIKQEPTTMVRKPLAENQETFVQQVQSDIDNALNRNKLYYERRAMELGISDKNTVKELTELAITRNARLIAHNDAISIEEKLNRIWELYQNQVNLSHRTSQSVLLQQYSTPAPISFLAGVFAGAYTSVSVFEPCAGNGLLALAARPEYTTVNEIDTVRLTHLRSQGYLKVLSQDAGLPFEGFEKKFESVLTNPPFGRLDEPVNFGTFGIKTLEHMMVINALNCMADNGRAAVIVGGHANYDDKGRIRMGANRIFLNYLYQHYNVLDVLNIDGKKLYSRQGTGIDVRMILIDGRKPEPSGHAPLYDAESQKPIGDIDTFFRRIMDARDKSLKVYEMTTGQYIGLRKKIDSLVPPKNGDWRSRIEKYKIEHRDIISQYSKDGYKIDHLIQQQYHNLSFKTFSTQSNMEADEEDYLEIQAKKLLQLQEQARSKRTPLSGQGNHQLYLIKFISEELHNKEYYAYAPAYSIEQAQRYAQNFVHRLANDEPPIHVTVESVLPWVEKHQLNGTLGAPYLPTSDSCIVLDTVVPDSMSFETHEALRKVEEAVGSDIDEFVRNRLGYESKVQLCAALAAEQIDAVALAIYNVEARTIFGKGQGMIIGDQTGIGKGRVAAAMIRYGVKRWHRPIFLTEKANLFTDIYRDLKAIGSPHLVPFIINAKDSKSNVLDESGDLVFSALETKEQDAVFESFNLPSVYDFVMATYSQFSSPKKPKKREFLKFIAEDNLLILDEAHNASGKGNTGQFIQEVVGVSHGVLFLSATFAKRPDNMPLYALKTVLRESNMDKDQLVSAINRGGVALQEIIASELVKEGQMLRRERSFEGVEVNYITLDEQEAEHRRIADAITDILRDIINFQNKYIQPQVSQLDEELARYQQQAKVREGTQRAGADAMPYFSKVFQVINQMLFAIKAESVADRAIMHLKEGKKPVIAFSSTMGAFLEDIENIEGDKAKEGDIISADFAEVLRRGLEGINRYSVVDADGTHVKHEIDIASLGSSAQADYQRITNKIEAISTGITISPIDVIIQKLKAAGYKVAEVTGRKYELELFIEEGITRKEDLLPADSGFPANIQNMVKMAGRFGPGKQLLGLVKSRKRMVTNEAFRKFNNNEIDVLLINQSGSTGASAHAIPTDKVPASQVKQRVMIVLQAELDISTEVQKRGRINRTGQIFKPIYDYVTSAIPAEQRLMMMLQSKLKSLDANTTSNQKQSKKILDVPDFLNKYGDILVAEYLDEHPEIDTLLDYPLKTESYSVQEPALKVSGRVAVLDTKQQQEFYDEMTSRYNNHIEYMKQTGEYDLEVERLELKARTISEEPVIMGKGGASKFGTDSILEEVEVDVLRKPMFFDEVQQIINNALDGKTAHEVQQGIIGKYEQYATGYIAEIAAIEKMYNELILKLPEGAKLQNLLETKGQEAYKEKLDKETKGLEEIREEKIKVVFNRYTGINIYLKRIFNFFYIGRPVNYVQRLDDDGLKSENHSAVFLGFVFDHKKNNPYSLSNIRLRFAIASGLKYIVIPASKRMVIDAIQGASSDLPELGSSQLESYWKNAVSGKMKNREIRHIVTGNILQGLGKYGSGRLISYTTSEGEEKKGILLSENWQEDEQGQERQITVPVSKVLPLLKSLGDGHEMVIGTNISIFRSQGKFKLIVPVSRTSGGEIYLNPAILNLVLYNNFNKVSNSMIGVFENSALENMLMVLERETGTSVTVTRTQFKYIKEYFPEVLKLDNFPKLEMLAESVQPTITATDEEMELEAQALILLQQQELALRRMRLKMKGEQ